MEFGLLSILAAFGVAFGILYTALTIQIAGGRKRRNLDAVSGPEAGQGSCEAAEATLRGFYGCHISNFVSGVAPEGGVWYRVADVLWHGEELEFSYFDINEHPYSLIRILRDEILFTFPQ